MTGTVNGLYFLLKLFTDTFFLFILRNIDQEAQTQCDFLTQVFSLPLAPVSFFKRAIQDKAHVLELCSVKLCTERKEWFKNIIATFMNNTER